LTEIDPTLVAGMVACTGLEAAICDGNDRATSTARAALRTGWTRNLSPLAGGVLANVIDKPSCVNDGAAEVHFVPSDRRVKV